MQWRRGNMAYRPMVPEDTNLEYLSDEDLERLERGDTHFEWGLTEVEDEAERARKIQNIVDRLWDSACRWSRLRGSWCDFRLFGYGEGLEGEELLFQDGRRCRLGGEEQSASGEGEARRSPDDERRGRNEDAPDWHSFHDSERSSLESLIGMVKDERNEAVRRTERTLAEQHLRWTQLNDAQRDTVAFQREQVEDTIAMRSGAVELKVRAVQEMQRTERFKTLGEVMKYGIDALSGNAVPFMEHVANLFGGNGVQPDTFPKFESAQQAMKYLGHTLTHTQLGLLFEKKGAQRALMGCLREAAAMELEAEALEHVTQLMGLFKSELFRDVASAEQQLCVRFIIGRMALHKVVSYGEAEADTQATR